MAFSENLRLSKKLPAALLGAAAVVGLSIGLSSYLTARSSMTEVAQMHLAAAAEVSRDNFAAYMQGIESGISLMAENPVTLSAIRDFQTAWESLADPTSALQQTYIAENPNPAGEKHLLDSVGDGSAYDMAHAAYHDWFRTIQQEGGYYDVFLFDAAGNLIYSVFKESDFATNFAANGGGQWRNSGLGDAYREAVAMPAGGSVAFADFSPYGPSADAPASFMAKSVFDEEGSRIGVIAYQLPVETINAAFSGASGLGQSGELVLIGEDRYLRNDSIRTPDVNDLLTTRIDAEFLEAAFRNGAASGAGTLHRDTEMQAVARPFEYHGARFAIIALKSTEEMMAPANASRNQMAMIGGALLFIVAVGGILLARSITRPVTGLVGEMQVLSSGNTDVVLTGAGRGDEIGDMTRAVAVFRDNMIERERLEAESAAAAEQRFKRQGEVDGLIAQFRQDVGAVIEELGANAASMNDAAKHLGQIAAGTEQQAGQASSASQEASGNVQTVAAAAEELSASITEIRRQVERTTEVVSDATERAGETNHQVEKLAETANAIGNVIALIQDIAEQTNLLALNATIEAARAGEAGKGFAVVASEVKGLAEQTAKATGDIAAQINEIQNSTTGAVDAINQISSTMSDVDSYMASIAASVEQQGMATNEISNNVAQAADGTQKVVGNITAVTEATTQTAQSADEVNAAAGSVTDNTKRLNETVTSFLRAVAAA